MVAVGRRLGTTPGQAWTLTLGTGLAALLLGTSLPPVLDARGAAPAPVAAGPAPALAPGGLTGLVPAPVPPAVAVPVPAPAPLPLGLPGPAPGLGAVPPAAPSAGAPAAQPFPAAPRGAEGGAPTVPPGAARPRLVPLTVREAGFATTDPSPLQAATPEDAVPVSARLGRSREQVHLRLAGTDVDLRLQVAEGSEGAESAAVRACRITDPDWEPARPGPAVDFDPADCVPGVRDDDGSLLFALGRFSDRTGPFGFAVVLDPGAPSGPAPRTFRLLLRPVPPLTPESRP